MNKIGELWQTRKLKEKLLWLLSFAIVAFMAFLYLLNTIFHLPFVVHDDISGWGSLLVGSIIGGYITFAILIYSDNQQDKIEKLITGVSKIEEKEQERIERWKSVWGTTILFELESIKTMYEILKTWLADYKNSPSNQLKTNIIDSARRNGDLVEFNIRNITRYLPEIKNYFDDPTLGLNLLGSFEQLSIIFKSLHMDYHWKSNDLETTFRMIDERKKILEALIERLRKEIPR